MQSMIIEIFLLLVYRYSQM